MTLKNHINGTKARTAGRAVAFKSFSSIRDAIALLLPLAKCGESLVAAQAEAWDFAPAGFARELVVKHLVQEAGFGGVGPAGGVVNARNARPIGRAQAHRAGLAARVELGAFEEKGASALTGLADGHDLRVRGRVVG